MASTKRSQRTATTTTSAADSSALFYESQFFYNYASSSKTASPPPTYTPLSRQPSYVAREERAQDPYRAISEDQRWLRRVRQQQQAARQQQQQVGGAAPRRSFDIPPRDEETLSETEEDEDEYQEEQSYIPLSAAMRRNSSNESRRSRTMSASSASSSTYAFAAPPPSPTHSRIPSSPTKATLPLWQQIPAVSSGQYALPCYSPPDPSSPFTYTETLFEDEDESEDEKNCSKGDCKTRRGGVTRLTKFASRRPSVGDSCSPTTPTKSSAASVHSVMSSDSATNDTTPSLKQSAKRQVDLITLRISLGVFHAKQRINTRTGVQH